MRTLLFHLDLGVGGAERLVVSLGRAASQLGEVVIATTRFSKQHCFPECLDDKYFRIVQYGTWIPRELGGKLTALCSVLRLAYLLICLLYEVYWRQSLKPFDVAINDQLALFNPLLKFLAPRVVFYCHFPEPLMAEAKGTGSTEGSTPSFSKRAYRQVSLYAQDPKPCRALLELFESHGISSCDAIWVNSEFTKGKLMSIYSQVTLPSVEVQYPCTEALSAANSEGNEDSLLSLGLSPYEYFISLNRLECKKNHGLALAAFASVVQTHGQDRFRLVICGGYDGKVLDNRLCLQGLEDTVRALGADFAEKVVILKSVSEEVRISLLRFAKVVVYTPTDEHFGIVPLEAMQLGTPVVAVNSGGPVETILDRETGSLVAPTIEAFAKAMHEWSIMERSSSTALACKKRAEHFGAGEFRKQVCARLEQMKIEI